MTTKKPTRAIGPFIPPPYELADATAFQALQRGEAEPHQQQRALKWLIEHGAGTYEFNYYPSDRDTAFALGRAFVGQQIVKLLRLNTSSLRRNDG
jgi:hypothetical protein